LPSLRYALLVLPVVTWWLLWPSLPNGDGLGYLKAAAAGGVYPGHLGYVALLRGISTGEAWDRLLAARIASLAGGFAALIGLYATARARGVSVGGALLAALGLGVSAGVVMAAADVESYAPALGALLLALAATARGWLWIGAICAAAAALFHVENVLFVLPLAALVAESPDGARKGERNRRAAAWFVVGTGGIVGAAYGLVVVTRGAGWLLGASHGFAPRHGLLATPVAALFGAGKTLVYAPYPYEASWPRVVACSALGIVLLAVLVGAGRRILPRAVELSWLLPYSAVGVAFFASDAERWLFLLPLAWLRAASRPRLVAALAAVLLCASLVLLRPDPSDANRARAAAADLRDGDLVIAPGHAWDEYLGFVARKHTQPLPLVYYAGLARLGGTSLQVLVAEKIAAAPRVLLCRLDDNSDARGWKDLRMTPAEVAALLPSGEKTPLPGGCQLFTPARVLPADPANPPSPQPPEGPRTTPGASPL
jgi:hypothetical protein